MTGKLCEMPVQPLSRSLPVAGTVKVICDGMPPRDGHDTVGLVLVPLLTHCTLSLFMKPLSFMTSVTGCDGLYFLSGLLVFFGTRLRGRTMVPAIPQPAGDTGGAWKTEPSLETALLKLRAVSVPGVQPLVASPTHTFRLMTHLPSGRPSASHVGSPSVQVSEDGLPVLETVAAAGPVSHTAEQLFFFPGTSTASAGDRSPAVSAIVAASEVRGESLIRFLLHRRAPCAPEGCVNGFDRVCAEGKTREPEFSVTV